MRYVWLLRGYKTCQQPDVPHIPTAYIYKHTNNVAPEDGLESSKHVEHPKIKTSYKNFCILMVHLHIAV